MDGRKLKPDEQHGFFFLLFSFLYTALTLGASCFVDGQSQTAILACFAPIAQSGRICVWSCVSCLKLVDAAGPGREAIMLGVFLMQVTCWGWMVF